ncbi:MULTISPECIES: HEAT repeat domain-containing protein [Clostridium]|uniref:HEAT repeat domain-containing protein n=1 Tax=Clostridium TaxID=1485 RepID=UPI001FA7408B|nr:MULTISPECIES: HEAT repeat domain-containing protein [Clostridium]
MSSRVNIEDMNLDEKLNKIDEIENRSKFNKIDFEVLEKFSHDINDEVRSKVAEVLIFTDNKQGEEILIDLLDDKDELVRTNACDSLCISKSENVIKLLKNKILRDKSNLVRGYAVASLVDIVIAMDYKIEDMKMFFINVLLREKDNWVKIDVYRGLYMLGDERYLNKLINILNDRNYRNRCSVVNILGALICKENFNVITSALENKFQVEKSEAVKSSIEDIVTKLE